jgi:DNA-binding MarR family transcriptional regulator
MTAKKLGPSDTPCLCNALRRASRAANRLYDKELRGIGLRITQYSLLSLLERLDEIRQGDLGPLTVLDETSLTRALRPLLDHGWVTVREGKDRRERLVSLTASGKTKLAKARPAWERAQKRLRSSLADGVWDNLMRDLPKVCKLIAEP